MSQSPRRTTTSAQQAVGLGEPNAHGAPEPRGARRATPSRRRRRRRGTPRRRAARSAPRHAPRSSAESCAPASRSLKARAAFAGSLRCDFTPARRGSSRRGFTVAGSNGPGSPGEASGSALPLACATGASGVREERPCDPRSRSASPHPEATAIATTRASAAVRMARHGRYTGGSRSARKGAMVIPCTCSSQEAGSEG